METREGGISNLDFKWAFNLSTEAATANSILNISIWCYNLNWFWLILNFMKFKFPAKGCETKYWLDYTKDFN